MGSNLVDSRTIGISDREQVRKVERDIRPADNMTDTLDVQYSQAYSQTRTKIEIKARDKVRDKDRDKNRNKVTDQARYQVRDKT